MRYGLRADDSRRPTGHGADQDGGRRRRGRWIGALCLGLLLCALGGCTNDFAPKSAVLYTRILAVRSELPRVALGQQTTLEALVVSTDDADAVELTWAICPFTAGAEDNYACVYPEEMPPAMIAALQGTGPQFAFTYDLMLQLFVDLVCERQEALQGQLPPGIPLPDCTQGYPARVRLTATNVTTGEEVAAVKTLNLLPSQGASSGNANPALLSLAVEDGLAVTARVGEPTKVRCAVDAASLEMFTRADDDTPRREEVLLSWFVRNGKLDKDLTLYSNEVKDLDKAQLNDVTPEKAGTTTIWCVARDGRGGTDWRRLDLEVVE